ncbi:hypothetical protein [Gemmatimonas sp.]|uniref:hypothetical protein n=1 Tax=Gemmatimonas sp. TaxID=1962908 RepID=UPI003983D841
MTQSAAWRLVGPYLLLACAPAAPTPSPAPAPAVAWPASSPPIAAFRVLLPRVQPRSNWTISAVTWLNVTGAAMPAGVSDEQRIDTRALVSMSFDRTAAGALRGSGQVDSFTVRSSIVESAKPQAATAAAAQATPSLLLIDALIDSTNLRVVTRPPLANECDRPEVSAMQLARELLVRIPDGIEEGDQWRDSTVTLVCRNGVPLTVYTTTHSTLDKLSRETLVVKRESSTRLEGKGGTAFRAFELVGSGSGSQRIEIAAATGILERLQGTSTLTMQVVERIPPGPPRSQQVLQRVELRAERRR